MSGAGELGDAWPPLWDRFREVHDDWLTAHPVRDGLYYRLPTAMIDRLASPPGRGRALLSDRDARAERALAAACEEVGAVAGAARRCVHYRYLFEPRMPSAREFAESVRMCPDFAAVADSVGWQPYVLRRVKGYAGFLVSDPAFRADRDELDRLGRAAADGGDLAVRAEFERRYGEFNQRWDLVRMATRDLPNPLLPLLHPVVEFTPTVGDHLVHVAVPSYYPLDGPKGVVDAIRNRQAARLDRSQRDHVDDAMRHWESYAGVLEVEHWQRVLPERYGSPPPWGFQTRLREAITAHLGLSPERVKELQEGLKACLAGEPGRAPWAARPKR